MQVRDFLKQIGKEAPPLVVLLAPGKAPFGRDPFEPVLADRVVERLVETYVDPAMADMVHAVFHADETPASQIVLDAQTLPFLAERRVIVVRGAKRYNAMSGERASPLAPLVEYLKNPSETTLLILIAEDIDKRKKLYRGCAKAGVVVECPQLDERAMAAWIPEEVKAQNKAIEASAVRELMARAGTRLSDVRNAIQIVSAYVGDAEVLREEDVVAACADVAEESMWVLTDAIAASNPEKALRMLYQLFDFGKSPDEVMMLINWVIDSAYRASPETPLEAKSRFVADKVAPLARKLGAKKLKAAFALCTDTHFMMRSTGVDPKLALELLVIKLSAPRRRPAHT